MTTRYSLSNCLYFTQMLKVFPGKSDSKYCCCFHGGWSLFDADHRQHDSPSPRGLHWSRRTGTETAKTRTNVRISSLKFYQISNYYNQAQPTHKACQSIQYCCSHNKSGQDSIEFSLGDVLTNSICPAGHVESRWRHDLRERCVYLVQQNPK